MAIRLRGAAVLATFVLATTIEVAPASAQPPIVHIGAGHPYSVVEAINNRGQVVGVMNFVEDEGRFHAYVWDGRALRDLHPTGGSHALDINDRGQIVGIADLGDGLGDPVIWAGGRALALPTPAGARCVASGITERGLIVGWCSGTADRLVFWRDGVFHAAALPDHITSVDPADINERGDVVGLAFTADGTRMPFLWSGGRLIDLNTISDRPFWRPVAINRKGQIAGEGPGPDGRGQGLLWERGSTIVLPPLPGSAAAIPYGLDDRGQVVGLSGPCGFVWSDGRSRPLSCLPGGTLAFGIAVNERGDVAGQAVAPPDNFLPNAVLWPGAARPLPRRVAR